MDPDDIFIKESLIDCDEIILDKLTSLENRLFSIENLIKGINENISKLIILDPNMKIIQDELNSTYQELIKVKNPDIKTEEYCLPSKVVDNKEGPQEGYSSIQNPKLEEDKDLEDLLN